MSRAVIIPERSAMGRAHRSAGHRGVEGEIEKAQTLFSTVTNAWQTSRRARGADEVGGAADMGDAEGSGKRRQRRRVGGWVGGGRTGRVAFRPTATATTHDRGGYGRPGRDIELVARGGRATSIDSSAPETKARGEGGEGAPPPHPTAHCPPPPGRSLTFHPLRARTVLYTYLPATVTAGVKANASQPRSSRSGNDTDETA